MARKAMGSTLRFGGRCQKDTKIVGLRSGSSTEIILGVPAHRR